MANEVILLGCGDVGPIHEPMERYSELVRDALAGADIRFAQVERTYSERGELRAGSGGGGVWPASATHGLGHQRLWVQCRLDGGQPRDGLGRRGTTRYDRPAARQGDPGRRRARPGGGEAAGGHRMQRAACRDARLLFRSARRLREPI